MGVVLSVFKPVIAQELLGSFSSSCSGITDLALSILLFDNLCRSLKLLLLRMSFSHTFYNNKYYIIIIIVN